MTNLSKTSSKEINRHPQHKEKPGVSQLIIDEASTGQRIDNFLSKTLKGVPKSHLYRILRSGEVRVNSKRIDATYRLQAGDQLRIPPIRTSQTESLTETRPQTAPQFDQAIIFEDESLLVIDKPAGYAVHGGSGISRGVIEQLRLERPHAKFLELVHRLDRETSGVLMLAKNVPLWLSCTQPCAITKRLNVTSFWCMVNGQKKRNTSRYLCINMFYPAVSAVLPCAKTGSFRKPFFFCKKI